MAIKYLKPNEELIQYIAQNMCEADKREVWASHNNTPMEAMKTGLEQSDYSVVISVNDEPCVMIGVVIPDILSGHGVIWMLGTEGSKKYRKQFLKLVPGIMKDMFKVCTKLYNYVHCENEDSIRWLKWVGFKFDEAKPYGVEKKLFHKFTLERGHYNV